MKLDGQRASEMDLSNEATVASSSVPVEFAERDEHQSGQRFLNGSAPRLKRHVAFCDTAAGDIASPAAGKDQKPFREFEGSALIGGEAAVPSPFLDDDDLQKLIEFFILLDAWDRRRNVSPVM
ncbi:MAG: hypothetical protein JSS95_00030 [Acidobacteria bacterium]|nr:hypothetical protein [Acidobacteriota bacterium]